MYDVEKQSLALPSSPEFTPWDLGLLILRVWWVKVATEMSSLVSMLFWTLLNPLKLFMEIFNILVVLKVIVAMPHVSILFTDVQAGVTVHVGVKYSSVRTSGTLLCPVVYSWIPWKGDSVYQSVIGPFSILWRHCVTFGDVLLCWVSHGVVWWGDASHLQTLAGSIATFRTTGVCWPGLMSHSFCCQELYCCSRLECVSFSYIFKLPSAIFIMFARYVTIVFVHHAYIHSCLNRHIFTRRLNRCLNGHRTTGIKLLLFMPFSSTYPFIDVANAISPSLLTSLSENSSCCPHFCLAVPSLSFLSSLLVSLATRQSSSLNCTSLYCPNSSTLYTLVIHWRRPANPGRCTIEG